MARKTEPLSFLNPMWSTKDQSFLQGQKAAVLTFFLRCWCGACLTTAFPNMTFDCAHAATAQQVTLTDSRKPLSTDRHFDNTMEVLHPQTHLAIKPIESLYAATWNRLPPAVQIALTPRPKLVVTTARPHEWGLFAIQKGAYDPHENVLRIHWRSRFTDEELQRTFFHEWGHSLALRTLSANTVCWFATELGPWATLNKPCAEFRSHLDDALFQPNPLRDAPLSVLLRDGTIPSRYALANPHEYLAETFAQWLAFGPTSDPRLQRTWRNLIDTIARQTHRPLHP